MRALKHTLLATLVLGLPLLAVAQKTEPAAARPDAAV
jgi:hypothetical protein